MKGHTYQRGKTWTYVIDAGKDSITGKRIQKTKGGFRTKGECQKAMDEMKYLITHDPDYQGAYVRKKKVHTVGECVEEYLEYKKEEWKHSTYTSRVSTLKKIENLYHLPIKDITKEDINSLLEKNNKLKQSSKESMYIIYKIFFRHCCKKGYITKNIMNEVKIRKEKFTIQDLSENDVKKIFYERDEVNNILETLDELKKKNIKWFQECLIIKIGIYTGMRIGEILALEINDIEDNIIKVYKSLNSVNITLETYCITTPKTPSSIRKINITKNLMDEINIQKNNIEKLKKRSSNWNKKNNFLFTHIDEKYLTSIGQPLKYETYRTQYAEIMAHINVRFLTFHKLRHTHCSLLAYLNIPLHMIGGRLGHKNADNVTKQIYLHTTNEYGQMVAEKFNEILCG